MVKMRGPLLNLAGGSQFSPTPPMAKVWNNLVDLTQSYGRDWSEGARFVLETTATSITVRAYCNATGFGGDSYGAIAVWTGPAGSTQPDTLVTTITPPTTVGSVDTVVSGLAAGNKRVFIDSGSSSLTKHYQPQAILIPGGAGVWAAQPGPGPVTFDGWAGRIACGDNTSYNAGDGYVVISGVLQNGPSNAYVAQRTLFKARVAAADAQAAALGVGLTWFTRIGTNDGTAGIAASDYQAALQYRCADIIANAPHLRALFLSSITLRPTSSGSSTQVAWWASYQAAAVAAAAASGAHYIDGSLALGTNDLATDVIHPKDAAASRKMAVYDLRQISLVNANTNDLLVLDGDSILSGSTVPATPAIAGGYPRGMRDMRARNVTLPSLAGTVLIGNHPTLTQGTWRGSPTLTYTLCRDGVADGVIVGVSLATFNAYSFTATDVGPALTVLEIPDGNTNFGVYTSIIQYVQATLIADMGLSQALIGGVGITYNGGLDHFAGWADQTANGNNVAQATGGAQPGIATINGRDCPNGATGSSHLDGPAISALITGSQWWSMCGIKPTAATHAAGNIYACDSVVDDTNLFWGLGTIDSTGPSFRAWQYDGAFKATGASAVTVNTQYIVETKYDGTNLSSKAGTDSFHSVAAGNLGTLTGTQRVGYAGAGSSNMAGAYLFMLISKTIPSANSIAAARAYFKYLFPSLIG